LRRRAAPAYTAGVGAGNSLVVLAGGQGTRLGGAKKPLIEVGGRPIIERIRARLSELAAELVIVDNDDSLAFVEGARVVPDRERGGGPLVGLLAGLSAARGELALVVAGDMPFPDVDLFRYLLLLAPDHDVVVPEIGGQLEPAHAIYRVAPCRIAVAQALLRGDRRLIAFHKDVRVWAAPEADLRRIDPDLRSFFNVNTPEDLARAAELAAGEGG
jgi:molybdopterin-guanine dinucleotide biosynthesis protein A